MHYKIKSSTWNWLVSRLYFDFVPRSRRKTCGKYYWRPAPLVVRNIGARGSQLIHTTEFRSQITNGVVSRRTILISSSQSHDPVARAPRISRYSN